MATSSKTSKRKRAAAKAAAEDTAAGPAADPTEPIAVAPTAVVEAQTRCEEASSAATPPGSVVVLASNCVVRDAARLKQTLCGHANESAPVTVDVRSLERIDTATIQVLCAFVRDRDARQQKVQWLGDSPALKDAARLLGVAGMLALAARDSHNNPGAAV